jgi:hypothetical protein
VARIGIAELVRRTGETVQKQQHGRIGVARRAIEEVQAVGLQTARLDLVFWGAGHDDLRGLGLDQKPNSCRLCGPFLRLFSNPSN